MAQVVRLYLDDSDGPPANKGDHNVLEGIGAITITALPGGMQSGQPSIGIVSELTDGSFVFLEMSLAQFQTVNAGLRGRYGDIS